MSNDSLVIVVKNKANTNLSGHHMSSIPYKYRVHRILRAIYDLYIPHNNSNTALYSAWCLRPMFVC